MLYYTEEENIDESIAYSYVIFNAINTDLHNIFMLTPYPPQHNILVYTWE